MVPPTCGGQMWDHEHMENKSLLLVSSRLCALRYLIIFTMDLEAYIINDITPEII